MEWKQGQPVALRATLSVDDRQIFKTHTESVSFRCAAQPQVGIACPVMAVARWQAWQAEPQGRMFQMSVDEARGMLKDAAAWVTGMSPDVFGLHSLRAGAATDAEKMGMCMSEIMYMGRWAVSDGAAVLAER